MKAIVAINNLGFIGLKNKLLWKSSDDLNHFKRLTDNKPLLCGYNTFQTLPNVVKTRTNVYLDVDLDVNNIDGDVWCIGGRKTYEKYCHLFTELHISWIDNNDWGDCLMPDFDNLNKDCVIYKYYFKEDK